MGITDRDETCIFKISIKMQFFWCNFWYQNSISQSFGYYWAVLLLTTVRYHELFDFKYSLQLSYLPTKQEYNSIYILKMPKISKQNKICPWTTGRAVSRIFLVGGSKKYFFLWGGRVFTKKLIYIKNLFIFVFVTFLRVGQSFQERAGQTNLYNGIYQTVCGNDL